MQIDTRRLPPQKLFADKDLPNAWSDLSGARLFRSGTPAPSRNVALNTCSTSRTNGAHKNPSSSMAMSLNY
ncbi:hypothetical protein [Zoogloea sp. LCSB751]|uniref:hypothetical protein n=1 Tax=Zoogloea sp. LCSB751 TaxID=1965277 RepID=UPI001117523A|nr:hypothetical protein [Zoogloea sp. LCSB751]